MCKDAEMADQESELEESESRRGQRQNNPNEQENLKSGMSALRSPWCRRQCISHARLTFNSQDDMKEYREKVIEPDAKT
jgi:hypothetical protein